MRFGWSSGYVAANAVKAEYPWRSMEELIKAGPSLHTLAGPVMVEMEDLKLQGEQLYLKGSWFYSYEYEEHVRYFEFSNEGTCWTLVGFVRGYLASLFEKDIIVYEEQCKGKGDHICQFVACTVELCPPEFIDANYFYNEECLASEFDELYKQLEFRQQMSRRADRLVKKLTDALLREESLKQLLRYVSDELGYSVLAERSVVRKPLYAVFIDTKHEAFYEQYVNGQEIEDGSVEVFPIRTEKVYYGKIVLVSEKPLDPSERIIINRSITAFLWYFNSRYKQSEKLWQQKYDFFQATLKNERYEFDNGIFTIDVTEKNRVLVLRSSQEDLYALYMFLERLVDDLFVADQYLVILLNDEQDDVRDRTERILEKLSKNFPEKRLFIGVGRQSDNVQDFVMSFEEAAKLCEFLVHCSTRNGQIAYYEDLQHVLLFLKTADPSQLANYYEQIIGQLVEYDQKHDAQFIVTLQKFFDCNGNLNKTAKVLNLSLPRLRYRLGKMEPLLAVDLKSGEGRFKCQLALQFYYVLKTIE